jgi:tRNA threonylcarbamoyladenosine biosynthesis protein TsaE
MENALITTSSKQTQKLGEILAKELKGGEIICLSGELGSGKTTFAQGVLHGLGAKKPYTSPTFVVMKKYHVTCNTKHITQKEKKNKSLHVTCYMPCDVYHIDAYRVGAKDILDLGWEEIIASKNNITIVEWAERIKRIIPKKAIWLGFEHLKEDEREISICKNFK